MTRCRSRFRTSGSFLRPWQLPRRGASSLSTSVTLNLYHSHSLRRTPFTIKTYETYDHRHCRCLPHLHRTHLESRRPCQETPVASLQASWKEMEMELNKSMLEYLSLLQVVKAEGLDLAPYAHLCPRVGIVVIDHLSMELWCCFISRDSCPRSTEQHCAGTARFNIEA